MAFLIQTRATPESPRTREGVFASRGGLPTRTGDRKRVANHSNSLYINTFRRNQVRSHDHLHGVKQTQTPSPLLELLFT